MELEEPKQKGEIECVFLPGEVLGALELIANTCVCW